VNLNAATGKGILHYTAGSSRPLSRGCVYNIMILYINAFYIDHTQYASCGHGPETPYSCSIIYIRTFVCVQRWKRHIIKAHRHVFKPHQT